MRTQTSQEMRPEDTVTHILTGEVINPEQYDNYTNICSPKVTSLKQNSLLFDQFEVRFRERVSEGKDHHRFGGQRATSG